MRTIQGAHSVSGVLCLSDKELFTELKNFLKAQLQRFPSVSGQKDG